MTRYGRVAMPRLDAERRAAASAVLRDRGIENALSAAQARLFVRSLQTTWQVPRIEWSEAESTTQFADGMRLLHASEIFIDLDGAASKEAIECYRRAGELFEWLARNGDEVSKLAPLHLYAAAAYQLGGLPAMAAGLLRQAAFAETKGSLYRQFLQADFDGVLRTCVGFWAAHPKTTRRESTAEILAEDVADRLSWYMTVEIIRVLGLIADCLRRGEQVRLDRALSKLKSLEGLAARTTDEEAWTLLTLLRRTAEGYSRASIYVPLLRMAEVAPNHLPRLRNFARDQYSRGRGILWTSQIQGLDRLQRDASFALCTPTGSGKTLIANLALVKELLIGAENGLSRLGLYLVPSRALAGEVEAKLTSELGHDLVITGLYGGSDWGITDFWLTADRPTVLIATVEKADALLRHLGPILLGRLRLLIIDEAHQVVADNDARTHASLAEHTSRSMRLESLVSRLLALKPGLVTIALTAVAGGASAPVARWVEGRADAEPVGVKYRSTRQLIGVLQGTPLGASRIVLDRMNGMPLYVRGRGDPVYLPLRIPIMPQLPTKIRNSLNHYNQLHVLWTALYLREGNRRILISIPQEPEVTMRWFCEAFQLDVWEAVGRFEPPADAEMLRRYREARAAAIDYCGPDAYEVTLLDHGIATNHGQMPQRLRRLMNDLIEKRICPITIATATLTEGVNLPFDMIFLTAIKRTRFNIATQRPEDVPLSASEFRNLAGRAGRPGAAEAMEGMTLVALPQRPSTTADGMMNTQRLQLQAMDQEYQALLQRLMDEDADRAAVESPLSLLMRLIIMYAVRQFGLQNEDAVIAWFEATLPEAVSLEIGTAATGPAERLANTLDELDAVLLAAIEEMSAVAGGNLDGPAAEAFLTNLWQRTFTHVARAQEALLERSFVKRGRAIVERLYPNPEQRRRLYQFGFPPCVGRIFEAISPQLRAELSAAIEFGKQNNADRLALFTRVAALLANQPAVGFRSRATVREQALLANWQGILSWWMNVPAPAPAPQELRHWQRFVTDNLEFRLGVAVGAVVAQAWSEGAPNYAAVPSLDLWRETTLLPWIGFWFRELLRWGTLDPFVAFCLAQGLSETRETASQRRLEFEGWLRQKIADPAAEDLIDPRQFLAWERSLRAIGEGEEAAPMAPAVLSGTDGLRGIYNVTPIIAAGTIRWIDSAGYTLAQTNEAAAIILPSAQRHDYELVVRPEPRIIRTYSARL
jgi:DEAD/DEAH box helicase